MLGAEQVLATIDQYHQMILAMGQRLGAVRTDLPLALAPTLSRAIGAAEDQAFVLDIRREGREAIAARVPAIAQQLTDMLRRLLEVFVTPEDD